MKMIYCYIDESGTASRKDKRPFIVAMVIFGSLDEVNEMIEKIRVFKLKNNIPQDFEFHYSRNAKTKKDKFVRFVKREVEEVEIFRVDKRRRLIRTKSWQMRLLARFVVEKNIRFR